MRYLEDLVDGQEFESAGRTLTDADIMAFCGVSGDFNQLHTNELWVREHTPFRGRIAHGLLVLSIASGLRCPLLDELEVIAYVDATRRFAAPAYIGDTIHARWRIDGTRASSSRPQMGVVTLGAEVLNQDGVVLQHGTDVILVARRPADAG
jgi:3-hydroxybutyryl-CoA dehydratase